MLMLNPSTLTNEELARYAQCAIDSGELNTLWQRELVARFESLLSKAADSDDTI